jgi:hypothetical protein
LVAWKTGKSAGFSRIGRVLRTAAPNNHAGTSIPYLRICLRTASTA